MSGLKQNAIVALVAVAATVTLMSQMQGQGTAPAASQTQLRQQIVAPQPCVCECHVKQPEGASAPAPAAVAAPSCAPCAAAPSAAPQQQQQPPAAAGSQTLHWTENAACSAPATKDIWTFLGIPKSNLDDEFQAGGRGLLQVVHKHLLANGATANRYAVNWGAHDGKSLDPIYPLYVDGWSGFAAELRELQFSQLQQNLPWDRVKKQRVAITPFNAVQLLDDAAPPKDMDLWKCDIDGYDLTVVQAVLGSRKYRPKMILMEINEKVPPPIQFAVNYHTNYQYAGGHLYGVSLEALTATLTRFNYRLIAVDWNNVLFVDGAYCGAFNGLLSKTTDVYDAGYRKRNARAETFPWNNDVDAWLTMDTHEALRAIQDHMVASAPYRAGNPSFTLHVDYTDMPVCGNKPLAG